MDKFPRKLLVLIIIFSLFMLFKSETLNKALKNVRISDAAKNLILGLLFVLLVWLAITLVGMEICGENFNLEPVQRKPLETSGHACAQCRRPSCCRQPLKFEYTSDEERMDACKKNYWKNVCHV